MIAHISFIAMKQTVRLYDVMRNTMRAKYNHKAAVLDCCFSDDTHSISGGIDRAVKVYDYSSQSLLQECCAWAKSKLKFEKMTNRIVQ
jgi:cell cycle arrest protein BUB3